MIVPAYTNKLSLEDQYVPFGDVDIHADCGFDDYFEPNEYNPERVKEHLQWTKPGILVSTGTERSFFDLAFSDEEKCEGLVVIDINPRVKAYVDFNVLLLRISKTRDEYLQLSRMAPEKLETMRKVIQESGLPEKTKKYYLKNFKPFGSIYLNADHNWRGPKSGYFTKCRYDRNEIQFSKLQNYAKSGNIIAHIGEINDLRFLRERNICIVDTSNILDYSVLNLKGEGEFAPRVIWTKINIQWNMYRSYVHENLEKPERREIKEFVGRLKDSSYNRKQISYYMNFLVAKENDNCENKRFNANVGAIYSPKTLKRVRAFVDKDYHLKRVKS